MAHQDKDVHETISRLRAERDAAQEELLYFKAQEHSIATKIYRRFKVHPSEARLLAILLDGREYRYDYLLTRIDSESTSAVLAVHRSRIHKKIPFIEFGHVFGYSMWLTKDSIQELKKHIGIT